MGADALSKTIQVRLLLRVLREHAASITDATLNALNCLAANSNDNKADYSPFADLSKLLPRIDLYLQVSQRCARFLRFCRDRGHQGGLILPDNLPDLLFPACHRLKLSWCCKACEEGHWRPSFFLETLKVCWTGTFHPNRMLCRTVLSHTGVSCGTSAPKPYPGAPEQRQGCLSLTELFFPHL